MCNFRSSHQGRLFKEMTLNRDPKGEVEPARRKPTEEDSRKEKPPVPKLHGGTVMMCP